MRWLSRHPYPLIVEVISPVATTSLLTNPPTLTSLVYSSSAECRHRPRPHCKRRWNQSTERLRLLERTGPSYSSQWAKKRTGAVVQPLRPPQGAPHHRPRISDRRPPPMMPLRAPSSPHAAQRRAYSGELLDPDGPQINPCAALSLSLAPILHYPHRRRSPKSAGPPPSSTNGQSSPVLRDGPQGQVWPAHESWVRLEASRPWPNATTVHHNFFQQLIWIIQVEFKPLEICSNSNKFNKTINSIPYFEFKHNL
jgi:hypothetical protein